MKYVVAIRAGANDEGVPEDFYMESRPIRGDFDEAPPLPEEYANNPLAEVVSVPDYRARQEARDSAFRSSKKFRSDQARKRLNHGFKQQLSSWRRTRRDVGIVYQGNPVPLTEDNLATIAALSNVRASLTYPVVLFGGAVTCTNANGIRDLEIAMGNGIAEIETMNSDFATRANSAQTVAELEAIESEMV
jgi:hypothetical protein